MVMAYPAVNASRFPWRLDPAAPAAFKRDLQIAARTTPFSRCVGCLLTVACSLWATVPDAAAAGEARRIIVLVGYITGDYGNAVQNGKVTNPAEYQEMREFSSRGHGAFEAARTFPNVR